MQKKCFKCEKVKRLSEFYTHPQTEDGYLGKCKKCTKKDVKQNRKENPEYYRQYERSRNLTSTRKEQHKKSQQKHRAKYSNKYRARTAVGNALRDGRLQKGICVICGSENVEAHHDDYDKPLEVVWVCFKHHREIHEKYLSPL